MILFPEKAPYGEYFLRCNGMHGDGFLEWVFHPGMLFGSVEKWWGEGGARDNAHEGLDIALFRDGDWQIHRLEAGSLVPAMYGGEVVRVGQDYLGKSVFVCHEIDDGHGRTLHTIYAHIRPGDHIRRFVRVGTGDVVGGVADPGLRDRKAPAHVHITAAWIPGSLPPQRMTWRAIGALGPGALLNPLELMASRYAIEELPPQM
jgi:murein DD-endopeptidase MepM/ murein hydrolase activator NlpD